MPLTSGNGAPLSLKTSKSPVQRPLEGRCILVTRAQDQASSLSDALRLRGAEVVEAPAIRIEPPEDWEPVDAAIDGLERYHGLLFTSANGVRFFFQRLRKLGKDPAQLGGQLLGAIGPATARTLAAEGVKVDVVPREFVAESFFEALKAAAPLSERRFLLPRADIARETLPELLRSAGAQVDVIVAYRTVTAADQVAKALDRILGGEIDAVTFTSGSTVRSFFSAVDEKKEQIRGKFVPASIGPITSRAIRELGLEPVIEARDFTTEGLANAIAEYYERLPPRRGRS